jgi:hypothetical protein
MPVEHLVDPPLFLSALAVHVLSLVVARGPQLLAEFLVEVDDQLAQTVLLLVGNTFVHAVLQLHGGLGLSEVLQVRLEFGDLATDIALGKDELVVVVCGTFAGLLAGARLQRFGLCLGGGDGEEGVEEVALDVVFGVGDKVGVQPDEFLKLLLYLADI